MSRQNADARRFASASPMAISPEKREWGGGLPPERSSSDPLTGGDPPPRRRGRKKREFTETQEQLIRYIAGETAVSGCACCTKRQLAEMLGRSVKTVDRCISDLRERGVIEVEMRFDERGGQMASAYRMGAGRGSR